MGIYEISLATVVGINIILAIGLNLITVSADQISLGHAAFYGIGAYTAAMLAKAGLPLVGTIPGGAVLAGLIGVVVGLTSLRVRDDFLAINHHGRGLPFPGRGPPAGFPGRRTGCFLDTFSRSGPEGFLILVMVLVVLVVLFSLWIKKILDGIRL